MRARFAVDHASPGAAGHTRVANLFAGLPWADGHFNLVTTLEILEHLPPDRVPVALAELAHHYGYIRLPTTPNEGGVKS